jgi:steroid delta-isomerase-like uncharacterized protein
MQPTTETRAETVRRFIEDVWNRGSIDQIGTFVTTTYEDKAYEPPNAQGHVGMVEKLKAVMPDARWTIESIVAQDDKVVVELTLSGTHQQAFRAVQAKGNRIQVRCYRTFVFQDALIAEHRALLDTDTLLKQMAA